MHPHSPRPPASGARGMVVTPHPAATRAGLDALRAGGNAVDAAIAANAALAVVYCHSCGLGGDAFALVWSPGDGEVLAFNGSGRAPAGLTVDAVRAAGHEREMPVRGPLPITVPGAVDAWEQLTQRLGRRPLAQALAPAIALAADGHELTALSAAAIERSLPFFDEAGRAVFAPAGRAPGAGERLAQPLLADTLRAIADGGADAFYRGQIAREIAGAVQAAGGALTAEDLAAHRGEWVAPISTRYSAFDAVTVPPNSQGITALIALNVLSALGADAWIGLPSSTPLPAGARLEAGRLHAQLEALKVAWSERDRCIGDPERVACDVEQLLSAEHAAALTSRLDPHRSGRFVPATPPGGGTVFLCTADTDGMMVSLIQSNWMGFGSGVMGGRSGVMLHNRGNYFSLDPASPNALAPGARPLHTLTPMILLRDGRPWVAMGAMGGDGQPQYMLQLVNALVDDGLDPQAAVERPRFVAAVERFGGPLLEVAIEADGAGPALVEALESRGHRVRLIEPRTSAVGWAQVIRREPDGSYLGGADPRADSLAAGL